MGGVYQSEFEAPTMVSEILIAHVCQAKWIVHRRVNDDAGGWALTLSLEEREPGRVILSFDRRGDKAEVQIHWNKGLGEQFNSSWRIAREIQEVLLGAGACCKFGRVP